MIFPIVVIVAMFVVLSASMIFLQEKKLTGFAVYDDTICGAGMIMDESSTLSENITCVELNGLNITCSSCTLNCQGYNFTGGGAGEGQTGLIITGSSITIKNCGMTNWFICNSSDIIDGGGNSGTCFNAASPACGDGSVDAGEQCDDGNTAAGDCCSATCQYESVATVCRAAAGVCDVAETCDGAVRIVKMRRTSHVREPMPMKITNQGIIILA